MRAAADETTRGAWATAAAFTTWGLVPVYWKAVGAISPREMIAWRGLWAVPFLAGCLTLARGWPAVRALLRNRRALGVLAFSAALIGLNWFVFIVAVANGQILESSLGYTITPLVNVLLGAAFLGERLTRVQGVAVGCAAAGVVVLVVATGTLPLTALVLAFSFSIYGLVRKIAAIDAMPGLFVETVLLAPLFVAWLIVLAARGETATGASATTCALVPLSGLITAVPLWLFAYGARRIRLVTVGLLQFISPLGQFVLSVFAFGETFTTAHAAAFTSIGVGVVLYLVDLGRRQRPPAAPAIAAAR